MLHMLTQLASQKQRQKLARIISKHFRQECEFETTFCLSLSPFRITGIHYSDHFVLLKFQSIFRLLKVSLQPVEVDDHPISTVRDVWNKTSLVIGGLPLQAMLEGTNSLFICS